IYKKVKPMLAPGTPAVFGPYDSATVPTSIGWKQSYENQSAASTPSLKSRQLPAASKTFSESMCDCEAASHYNYTLRDKIIHWNDKHNFSRDAIADFLDELHDKGIIDIEF